MGLEWDWSGTGVELECGTKVMTMGAKRVIRVNRVIRVIRVIRGGEERREEERREKKRRGRGEKRREGLEWD